MSVVFTKKTKKINDKITPDFVPMIRIVFWNSMGFFFFWFLIPYATTQLLEATGTELGLSFAGQTFGGLISAPIVGYLTDKISKKLLVLLGSFGRGIAYIILYFGIIISSLPIFVIGLFTLGFFVGLFWSPLDALVSQKSDKTYRSSAFGMEAGMLGRGNLVGSILSFLIFGLASFFVPDNLFLVYSPLILFAVSNIYAGIIFKIKVDESLTYEDYNGSHTENDLNGALSNKQSSISEDLGRKKRTKMSFGLLIGFIVLILAFMTSNINQTIGVPFYQRYLIDDLKITNGLIIMIIYFPSQIISLLLAPRMGKFADKINPSIGIAIVSGLGSLVTYFIIISTNGIEFSILLLADSTFAWAGNLVLQNVLSRISKSNRGKIFGSARWISFLGAIIGPIIGGFLYDNIAHTAPFYLSIFVELSVIPLYISSIKLLRPYMAEKLKREVEKSMDIHFVE
jgi:DHA1 family multidrug resistance protein-like MFS transporter